MRKFRGDYHLSSTPRRSLPKEGWAATVPHAFVPYGF